MKLKNILQIASITAISFSLIHCPADSKKDNSAALAALALSSPSATTTVSADITGNTTWKGTVVLDGKTINVTNNSTLTIEAGTKIYGRAGSALFIHKGSKINAVGTATNPIVFTSSKTVGQRAPGDWGGVVIIGGGTNTRTGGQTEGANKTNYGGSGDNTDSSGSLKYVRVEFAGNEVSAGDELNGISSYTVGSGTSYEYVEVHRGLDDGFEFWGGAVTVKYALVTGGMDDDFDMDEGFLGKMQFLIGHKYPTSCGGTASSDPHGMEMDGSHNNGEASTTVTGLTSKPSVANFTLIGAGVTGGAGMRFREGMQGYFTSGLIYGFSKGNYMCNANAGTGQPTSPTVTNVLSETAQTASNTITCTSASLATAISSGSTLAALPITSAGSGTTDNCVFTTKPDYSTAASVGTPSASLKSDTNFNDAFFTDTQYYGGASSTNKWYEGWTEYVAK